MQLERCLAVALVLALPGAASAQPAPPPAPDPAPAPDPEPAPAPDPAPDPDPAAPPPPADPVHTAASVSSAPPPGQVTGVSREEPRDGTGRAIGRVFLYPVRGLVWLTAAPLRGGAWLYERYQLRDRWKSIFFNDTGTIGLYPVALIETGFGLNAGARFVHRDLFGARESLKARASFGGRFRQIYSLKLDTGERLGRNVIELEGEYEIRPRDRFFGIGNGDLVEEPPMGLIDPFADPTAVDTRFRQRLGRVSAIADILLAGPLSARASSAMLWKRFEASDESDIAAHEESTPDVYDPAALPAFEEGTDYLYNELELRLDTRHRATRYEPETQPSKGVLLSGFAGLATPIARSDADYVRYGADLQIYLRISASPRVLVLRGLVEEVKGTGERIPFADLPRLGGPILLRGYDQDRFRDRALALTSAEYIFDLTNMLNAFAFTDVGRVYPALSDIEPEDLRVGFGGGLQLQTDHSYLGRISLASSIDGGLLFHLSFDPVYDPKARVERK
ncbi:MAG TPA: BamA/TamA family outer membrane protein [Kofleriaceae bacterium]|nr:BamA/TamA family outer membrane protein [Kofleriaceae bacterium]